MSPAFTKPSTAFKMQSPCYTHTHSHPLTVAHYFRNFKMSESSCWSRFSSAVSAAAPPLTRRPCEADTPFPFPISFPFPGAVAFVFVVFEAAAAGAALADVGTRRNNATLPAPGMRGGGGGKSASRASLADAAADAAAEADAVTGATFACTGTNADDALTALSAGDLCAAAAASLVFTTDDTTPRTDSWMRRFVSGDSSAGGDATAGAAARTDVVASSTATRPTATGAALPAAVAPTAPFPVMMRGGRCGACAVAAPLGGNRAGRCLGML